MSGEVASGEVRGINIHGRVTYKHGLQQSIQLLSITHLALPCASAPACNAQPCVPARITHCVTQTQPTSPHHFIHQLHYFSIY